MKTLSIDKLQRLLAEQDEDEGTYLTLVEIKASSLILNAYSQKQKTNEKYEVKMPDGDAKGRFVMHISDFNEASNRLYAICMGVIDKAAIEEKKREMRIN